MHGLSLTVDSLQTATLRPYLNAVRATLQAALCLENFSSQVVERHNKPEVEVRYVSLLSPPCCRLCASRLFADELLQSHMCRLVQTCVRGLKKMTQARAGYGEQVLPGHRQR